MYGLNDNTIEELKNIFSKTIQIEKVLIYGSRAKGNFRKGSDIDLSFYGKNLTMDILFKIEEDIEELNLPYIFDLSIFSHIDNEDLTQHINRVGKIFYENTSIEIL